MKTRICPFFRIDDGDTTVREEMQITQAPPRAPKSVYEHVVHSAEVESAYGGVRGGERACRVSGEWWMGCMDIGRTSEWETG